MHTYTLHLSCPRLTGTRHAWEHTEIRCPHCGMKRPRAEVGAVVGTVQNPAVVGASTVPGDVGKTGTITTEFVKDADGRLHLRQTWKENP